MLRCDDERAVAHRIESEYVEFPGLALTKAQARRLFGLDPCRCDVILDGLVEARVLRRTEGERYVLNRDTR